jgi:uncharacterized protein (DUF885 family)
MDRRAFLATAGAAALGVAAPAGLVRAQAPAAPPAGGPEDLKLRSMLDRFFYAQVDEHPQQATALGLDKGERAPLKRLLEDRSPEARNRDLQRTRERLAELKTVDRDALTDASRVDYDVVAYRYGQSVENTERFPYGRAYGNLQPYAVTQQHGAYQSVPDFLDGSHTIETRDDADAYIARLRQFPIALGQDLEQVRIDQARLVVPPSFTLDTAIAQLEALRAPAPADSVMVKSVVRRTQAKGITGADYGRQAAQVVEFEVYPALDRHLAAIRSLRARADARAGVWKLPQGDEYYAAAVKASTTTPMAPPQVHQMGLEQVADITGRMDAILKARGLTQGTVAARMTALGEQPENRYANTDEGRAELLARLNANMRALDARLPQFFGRLPKAKVEIERVPPFIQDGASNGYYRRAALDGSRPATFFINLKDTAEWPKFTLDTLIYHEASPGHHLQVSLQQESTAIPLIRRTGGFSAYSEGWALYAEQLADELGVYKDDPLGRLGYLQSFLFRAARLVVDTGIHYKKWTRDQATQYLVDTTGYAQGRSQREIDRYCVNPGQALSYKVGHTMWTMVRDDAKATLGPKFDIKAFHDAALADGAMPLTVLQARMAAWAAGQKA